MRHGIDPCVILSILAAAVAASAQVPKGTQSGLDAATFASETLHLEADLVAGELAPAPVQAALARFAEREGGRWRMVYDRIAGAPGLMEGGRVPVIPGRGNSLRPEDLGLPPGTPHADVPLELVERRIRALMARHPELFAVDGDDLVLRPAASGPILDHVYVVDFQPVHGGVPVVGARVVFRINSGNLIQIGSEHVSRSLRAIDPRPSLDARDATRMVLAYAPAGGGEDELVGSRLAIVPVMEGRGRLAYRLLWIVTFRRPGVRGLWEGRVDAHTGEIVSFLDVNRYGRIEGGVQVTEGTPEESRPLAFMDHGPGLHADAAGTFPGTTGTSELEGRYARIEDTCGAVSLDADAAGVIDFGTSAGTDCVTPGTGGPGNTHAARTVAYQLTSVKRRALDFMPGNVWLSQPLTAMVNVASTCNAYWDGANVIFFASGGGCLNTGELPGVVIHEFGHGIDDFDGIPIYQIPHPGSTEGYADSAALLFMHESCLGKGFFGPTTTCTGYGDPCTTCTGVREADWAGHQSGVPHTPANFVGPNCPTSNYRGPCGYLGPCEGHIQSESVWDLAVRDLPAWGLDAASAWSLAERLWWASRSTASDPYACPDVNSSHGCAAGTLDTVLRALDDCDGDLANGTPHATAIFAALDRHAIGCASATNVDDACGCPALGVPVLSGSAGIGANDLSWTAVAGATAYDVMRNDSSCAGSFTRLARVTGTSHRDLLAAVGQSYNYRVEAVGAPGCPQGRASNCISLAPICVAAPTGLTASPTPPGDVTLDWTGSVPPSPTYDVYRGYGTCPGMGMTLLAAGVTGTSYVDTTATGTLPQAYVVTAHAGTCESLPSNCDWTTPSGPCTATPIFDGLASVTDAGQPTCALDLAWEAANPLCSGGPRYNVYRGTTDPFTPSSANRIVVNWASTYYRDADGLASGTNYYYIVRAYDRSNGAEDDNLVVRGAAPAGPPIVHVADDGGDTGAAVMIPTAPWSLAPTGGASGPGVWQTGVYPANVCADLRTPSFGVTTLTTLAFATRHEIAPGYDKGEVQISTDGGGTWSRVDVGYPFPCEHAGGACGLPAGLPYFSGRADAYVTHAASLDPWAGSSAIIRFVLSSNFGTSGDGWWVDDIRIQEATTCSTSPPSAEFYGLPLSGPAPLSVTFTDLSSGLPTSWSWDFGDGGTSTAQSPTHVYAAAGTYDVSLTASNAGGSDTRLKTAYVDVGPPPAAEIVTGAGVSSANPPIVNTWDHATPPQAATSFVAYGAGGYGVNVGTGQIAGGAAVELLTGPGPSASYGPQIRAFTWTGTAIPKVNFYAYGTLRYGAHGAGGDVDADGWAEILTTPGSGDVFGPHVRGFAFDGAGPLVAIPSISFFAYSTIKFGARVAAGDVESDGFDEIATGAGAGSICAPHVRAFDYDGVAIVQRASLFAFATGAYGACVGAGDTDGDGAAEVMASHGPDPLSDTEVVGFDLQGAVQGDWSTIVFPFGLGGAEVGGGDLDGDGIAELIAGRGWGTAAPSEVAVVSFSGSPGFVFTAYPGQSYGTKVAAGDVDAP